MKNMARLSLLLGVLDGFQDRGGLLDIMERYSSISHIPEPAINLVGISCHLRKCVRYECDLSYGRTQEPLDLVLTMIEISTSEAGGIADQQDPSHLQAPHMITLLNSLVVLYIIQFFSCLPSINPASLSCERW